MYFFRLFKTWVLGIGEIMKRVKGFISVGNGLFINPNQVVEETDTYIVCKNGERYEKKELPKIDGMYHKGLYGTTRED